MIRKDNFYAYIKIIYSVTIQLSIVFFQKFLHSKRELQQCQLQSNLELERTDLSNSVIMIRQNQKTENSNLYGYELHKPSSKGTKLLFQVIKAMMNQSWKKGSSSHAPSIYLMVFSRSLSPNILKA